uniref:Uncharacterized protein n=1 Tax=Babesia bovis TaxID=5865 RepID=S6C8I7_BABBO|nr:hypothetical protein [Babesia bovis]
MTWSTVRTVLHRGLAPAGGMAKRRRRVRNLMRVKASPVLLLRRPRSLTILNLRRVILRMASTISRRQLLMPLTTLLRDCHPLRLVHWTLRT